MPEEKKDSALEEFMAGLGSSNKDPLESKDPFAPKGVEIKQEIKEVEEKPVPFHKDPKVLRFIEKEVSKRVGEVKPTQQNTVEAPADVADLVGAFTAIIGNDTPEKVAALRALEKSLTTADERAAAKAVERLQRTMQEQSQAETEAERKAQDELDESFETIEETYNVDLSSNTPQAKKTRSEFVEYIRKIAPKNEEGEVTAFPDLSAAFETYQEIQKKTPAIQSRAKELASRSMSRSSDVTVAPVQTKKDWKSIDKLFANLTS